MNGLTNATSQDVAWCPKYQTAKWCCWFDGHFLTRGRFTENLSIYLSPPAPNSPLQNPSNFGATASHWLLYFLLFFFFSDFNRMDAWSLMRGDAFIHFVCGSRRVNIRLGILLLIPKSPHISPPFALYFISLHFFPNSYLFLWVRGINALGLNAPFV